MPQRHTRARRTRSPSRVDRLIIGATIVDGTGAPARTGDVGVRDGRIVLAPDGQTLQATERIEAAGLVLSPGFIDIHSHSDFASFVDPLGESKAFDGVTCELSGNCGFSAIPLDSVTRQREGRRLERFDLSERDLSWTDWSGYRDAIERRTTAIHRPILVGHGSLRAAVMGHASRPATRPELDRMKGLLGDLLDQGAIGFSTGLIYPPGCFAGPEEVLELAREVARRDRLYASHIRGEGANLLPALDEVLHVATVAGVRTQVSHLKASGRAHWHKIDAAIGAIERARAGGARVMADRYPYTATNTGLDQLLRKWAYEGGPEAELARLTDPGQRRRLLGEMREDYPPEHFENVMIASTVSAEGSAIEGMTVAAIASERGAEPYETVLEILIQERTDVGAVYFVLSEDNCRKVLGLPWVMIASDATAQRRAAPRIEGMPHPRAYGTFARALGHYGRGEQLMSLETAVAKMTSLPASQMGLTDRGVVRDGAVADLVLFDADRFIDKATYTSPHQRSEGLSWLLIGGEPVIAGGVPTGRCPGRVLGLAREGAKGGAHDPP